MNHKTYCLTCGFVFLVVGAAHLTRLIAGWEIEIAGWVVPYWLSILGLILPGFLSAYGFVLASRAEPRRAGAAG
ncbi:MAG TPA: hypothetical protein VGK93_05760 [Candidatus Eisenbacteria bacterium]|jgi:hypothetical protein